MSETMRAMVLPGYNQPLELRQVPVPHAGPGEVVVKVTAAGVCHSDLTLASHQAPENLPYFPWILGHENAGYISEVGAGVLDYQVGDAVAIHCGQGCGKCRMCRAGREYLCFESYVHGYKLLGVELPGGFAEYMNVPSTRTLVKIDSLDPIDAAPLTDAGITAYGAVSKLVPRLAPGTTVVVFGVGGVGSFAVQYLKALTAARVVVVARSEASRKVAFELGADDFVFSDEEATTNVLRLTGGDGAVGVLDLVGSPETAAQALQMVGMGGAIVLVGIGQGGYTIDWSTKPEVSATTSYMASMDQLREVMWLASTRGIKADVVTYPLEKAQQALDDLADRKFTGRAVLVP